jgi:RNA polymerase sigma-54 factor
MTQEMQLAVKMLQLTSFELIEYIEDQLVENPLLEAENEDKPDADPIDDYISSLQKEGIDFMEMEDDKEYVSPLHFIAKESSLWDCLREQLRLIPLNKSLYRVGEYIIDNINENGYLTVGIDNISSKFGIDSNKTGEMIEIIQSLDPPGICARNLSECLILQLKRKEIEDKVLENIILNMLEDVGEGRIQKISKANDISLEKTKEYIDIIKVLDPKPGIRLCSDTTRYIIPDVYIEKIDGHYVVSVNEESIPQVKVNNGYKRMLRNKNSPEYMYVKEKLQSAIWLIKSIEQRMSTIKRVVTAILEYQIDFFEVDSGLLPLTLKQIAETTELHESTISRAVNGKYVQTPKGLFEIKNFFIKGIQNKNGEDISTLKIKNRIKEVIKEENQKKPFSDQQISDILRDEGIDISRRTVAKYREEMGILASSKRKE